VPATPGQAVDPNAATGAMAVAVALLLGPAGSVVGGWMGSGEPMSFTCHRTRGATTSSGPAASDRTTRV
jgi:hypothetical protein